MFAGVTVLAWTREHVIGLGCIGRDTRTYWSWLYWHGHENILVLAVLAWMQEHIIGLGCIGMDTRTSLLLVSAVLA